MKARMIAGILACAVLLYLGLSLQHKALERQAEGFSVQLPTADGYDGGTYPKWAPLEFTYKNYSGDPPIGSEAFEDVAFENLLQMMCFYLPERFKYLGDNMEETVKLAETDPDAMYVMYKHYKYDVNNKDLAIKYLERAALKGHVMATLDYAADIMGESIEKDNIIKSHYDITPYTVYADLTRILETGTPEQHANIIRNSGEFVWNIDMILNYYEVWKDRKPEQIEALMKVLPDYNDYKCEMYYRACIVIYEINGEDCKITSSH